LIASKSSYRIQAVSCIIRSMWLQHSIKKSQIAFYTI
jgi:hypothetical protein